MAIVDLCFPQKLQCLFMPFRYKILYGGRGGAKSWSIARALLLIARQKTVRILCAREIQKSLEESVHKLLKDQIGSMGLSGEFEITQSKIRCVVTGSEFSFEGIKFNVDKIKSYEGIDICWVEEAHHTSKESWDVLTPTIRKEGSEIWVSFNPQLEEDETYQRFVVYPPPNSVVVNMSWRDNPGFNSAMMAELEHTKKKNFDDYLWIWEGQCRVMLDGAVYAEEFRNAKAEGRIRDLPYDPILPVHVFADLGWADSTALWFVQRGRFECRFLQYYSERQKPWSHFLKYIQMQGYVVDTIWLPHDARQRNMASGTSVWEITKKAGFKRKLVPRLKLFDGINAARTIFPICYFDDKKCSEGLKALQHYRYETREESKDLSRVPVHDWSSHAADGFRYSAIAMRGQSMGAGMVEDEDVLHDLEEGGMEVESIWRKSPKVRGMDLNGPSVRWMR